MSQYIATVVCSPVFVAVWWEWWWIAVLDNRDFLFTDFHGHKVRVALYWGLALCVCVCVCVCACACACMPCNNTQYSLEPIGSVSNVRCTVIMIQFYEGCDVLKSCILFVCAHALVELLFFHPHIKLLHGTMKMLWLQCQSMIMCRDDGGNSMHYFSH